MLCDPAENTAPAVRVRTSFEGRTTVRVCCLFLSVGTTRSLRRPPRPLIVTRLSRTGRLGVGGPALFAIGCRHADHPQWSRKLEPPQSVSDGQFPGLMRAVLSRERPRPPRLRLIGAEDNAGQVGQSSWDQPLSAPTLRGICRNSPPPPPGRSVCCGAVIKLETKIN